MRGPSATPVFRHSSSAIFGLCFVTALLLSGCGGGVGSSSSSTSPADSNTAALSPQPTDPSTEESGPDIDSELTSFYFSYDESGSTASRDLALSALADSRIPASSLGRPYEFLNAESFNHFDASDAGPFKVSMGMLKAEAGVLPLANQPISGAYALGINLTGPELSNADRRNVVLTLLLDVSGSMESAYATETRSDLTSLLDVAKFGISKLQASLKPGDRINLVTFSTNANVILENYSTDGDTLDATLDTIVTEASTDIDRGVALAYQVANRTYDVEKANRVVILTDAYVNTGELDPAVIAQHTTINGLEGIYFSGLGIGNGFNDQVLDSLTDIGKGTYSAMITPVDAERIFTTGFQRFLEPAVKNVRFQLTYPQALDQLQSFAEEISADPEEVQPVNFSYNSDQFFLELFSGPGQADSEDVITLTIDYENADGQKLEQVVTQSLGDLLMRGGSEIKSAAAVTTLAQLISRSLDCETVLASGLYNETNVANNLYSAYRQHISTFCSL